MKKQREFGEQSHFLDPDYGTNEDTLYLSYLRNEEPIWRVARLTREV